MSSDQFTGLSLAISSSVFIGSSFIIKKKGLRLASSQGLRAGELPANPSPFPAPLQASVPPTAYHQRSRQRRLLISASATMVVWPAHDGRWRSRKLRRLRIRPGDPGDAARSPQHHRQVPHATPLLLAPYSKRSAFVLVPTPVAQTLKHLLTAWRSAILAHLMLNERLNVFGVLGCALCIVGSCVIVLHAPPEREVGSLLEIWRLAMQPGACRSARSASTAQLHGRTRAGSL